MVPHLCVVHVIQAQTADVVAVLHGHWRENLLDGQNLVGHHAIENRAIDQVRFYFGAIDTVKPNVSAGIQQLADMGATVFYCNEADEMRPGRHSELLFDLRGIENGSGRKVSLGDL